jgi:hypothetical protein
METRLYLDVEEKEKIIQRTKGKDCYVHINAPARHDLLLLSNCLSGKAVDIPLVSHWCQCGVESGDGCWRSIDVSFLFGPSSTSS